MAIIRRRFSPPVVMGLLVSIVACLGCGERKVKSTASEIYWKPPHVVETGIIEELSIKIDGQELASATNEIQLTTGNTAVVQCTGKVDESSHEGLVSKSIFIRFMPSGSTDAEWDGANRRHTWPDQIACGFAREKRDHKIRAKPGTYDVRAFFLIQGHLDDLPKFTLIAKGSAKVSQ